MFEYFRLKKRFSKLFYCQFKCSNMWVPALGRVAEGHLVTCNTICSHKVAPKLFGECGAGSSEPKTWKGTGLNACCLPIQKVNCISRFLLYIGTQAGRLLCSECPKLQAAGSQNLTVILDPFLLSPTRIPMFRLYLLRLSRFLPLHSTSFTLILLIFARDLIQILPIFPLMSFIINFVFLIQDPLGSHIEFQICHTILKNIILFKSSCLTMLC